MVEDSNRRLQALSVMAALTSESVETVAFQSPFAASGALGMGVSKSHGWNGKPFDGRRQFPPMANLHCPHLSIRMSPPRSVRRNAPGAKRVFNCDGQIVNRLFHGPLGNEHFELGVGRNIGASGTF